MPVVILGGLGTHLTSLDESAALTALYTIVVEVFIHKDLSLKKDLPRVAKASMILAGAIILILSMANALINYVVDERHPRAGAQLHARARASPRPGSSSWCSTCSW